VFVTLQMEIGQERCLMGFTFDSQQSREFSGYIAHR
jgi:hypothetical protein